MGGFGCVAAGACLAQCGGAAILGGYANNGFIAVLEVQKMDVQGQLGGSVFVKPAKCALNRNTAGHRGQHHLGADQGGEARQRCQGAKQT